MTEFTISATTSRFTEIRKVAEIRLEAVRTEIRNAGRAALADASAAFFERNPGVHGIRWTQYTPYWMDGEECTFSANEPELELTKRIFDDGQHDLLRRRLFYLGEIEKARAFMEGGQDSPPKDRWAKTYSQRDVDRAEGEIAKIDEIIESVGGADAYARIVADFNVISRFIKSIKNSDLELIFGDHVQVSVTKDGVTVSEYDHD